MASTLLEMRLRSASSSCTGSARSSTGWSGAITSTWTPASSSIGPAIWHTRLTSAPRSARSCGMAGGREESRAARTIAVTLRDLILNGFQPIDRGRLWR